VGTFGLRGSVEFGLRGSVEFGLHGPSGSMNEALEPQ
jgi:hypothetical protein